MTNLALTETWTDAQRFDPLKEYLGSMSHVRVYPYSPGIVNVQIRSESEETSKRKGWYIISNARLNFEAAQALHAALQVWLEEQDDYTDNDFETRSSPRRAATNK